jgi:hypothetical protein
VKALVFDTFGTVVDWRGSLVQEGRAWEKPRGISVDWAPFADRWRAGYAPEKEIHDCAAVERQPGTACRHGQTRRSAVGADSVGRIGQVMMCAAHSGDLMSARSFGLRTGFVHRPLEYGPVRKADTAKPGDFDVVSTGMVDLASKLGA